MLGPDLVNVWAGSVNILMVTSGNEKALSRFNATMLLLGTISGLMFISTHALFASIVIRAVMMAITNTRVRFIPVPYIALASHLVVDNKKGELNTPSPN